MLLLIDIILIIALLFVIFRFIFSSEFKNKIIDEITHISKRTWALIIFLMLIILITTIVYSPIHPGIPLIKIDIQYMRINLNPDMAEQLQINTTHIVSATLSAPDGITTLSHLNGDYAGINGRLQDFLGVGNTPCISATLDFDPGQVDVEPSQPQEYSLDQSSITWRWLVTPKQATQQIILLNFQVMGETHCDGEIIKGPYTLTGNYNYSFTVVDPNENPIISILKHVDVGGAITAALGTILAGLCGWIGGNFLLKRRKIRLQERSASRSQKKRPKSRR